MVPLAIALEEGRLQGAAVRVCSAAWGLVAARSLVRRVDVPSRVRVVAVGGATLGGSGKTPLAIAAALELSAAGARVALVGHAYRARPGRARVVRGDDAAQDVGDEALVAARALSSAGVPVVVGPGRAEAIAMASGLADVLVLDGVAQTAPRPAALALLALDAAVPWGLAAAVPPAGDLRAPRAALLAACDGVVHIGGQEDARPPPGPMAEARGGAEGGKPEWRARLASAGVRTGRGLRTWDDLAGARVGVLSALARPERFVRSLADRGIAVRCLLRAPDHGPVSDALLGRAARSARALGLDVWVATEKCAVHFGPRSRAVSADTVGSLGAPVGVVDMHLVLCRALSGHLRHLAAP